MTRQVVMATAALVLLSVGPRAAPASQVCGDVDDSGEVTAADALAVLRKAVGQDVPLQCPAGRLPRSGQTISYGPGSDGEVQAGAARSFTDNGDGTVTDNVTGLMWEKKSDDDSIHDWDNRYTWGMDTEPYTMNGTMVTELLASLNSEPCFAGHCDWRIPNVVELETLADFATVFPVVSPAFDTDCMPGCTVTACSCTQAFYYWSSTTYQYGPASAWYVYFGVGYMGANKKTLDYYARAVRGGS